MRAWSEACTCLTDTQWTQSGKLIEIYSDEWMCSSTRWRRSAAQVQMEPALFSPNTHAQFHSQRSMLSRFIPLTQASKFSVCCTFHYYDKLNKTIAQRGSIFFARVSTFHCIQFLGVLSIIILHIAFKSFRYNNFSPALSTLRHFHAVLSHHTICIALPHHFRSLTPKR